MLHREVSCIVLKILWKMTKPYNGIPFYLSRILSKHSLPSSDYAFPWLSISRITSSKRFSENWLLEDVFCVLLHESFPAFASRFSIRFGGCAVNRHTPLLSDSTGTKAVVLCTLFSMTLHGSFFLSFHSFFHLCSDSFQRPRRTFSRSGIGGFARYQEPVPCGIRL